LVGSKEATTNGEQAMTARRITKVIPLEDFTLILLFDSGELRILDMNPYIHGGGIWGQLKDWEVFSKVRAQEGFGGLVWTNELDYCPDSAFISSKPLPLDICKSLMDVYSARKKTEKKYKAAS
jgi:hypothetical protein